MMAEYAACYGGLPDAADPWPLFVALLDRIDRFENRLALHLLDGVSDGIAAALGGGTAVQIKRDRLFRQAYPVERRKLRVIEQGGGDAEA